MSIQHIQQTRELADLDDLGPVPVPLSEPACRLRGRKVAVAGTAADTGVWECSPGKFRRQVQAGEVMHILEGECTFTPDGQAPIAIRAGDTIFMPPMTTGVWDVRRTVRKVYVLVPPAGQAPGQAG